MDLFCGTRRLYEEDAYRTEFTARVQSCRPGEGGYRIVLDETAFYPEGGGQPCDWGTLEAAHGGTEFRRDPETATQFVRVWDVQDRDGRVEHFTDGPLEPGETVRGRIDWKRRLTHMREHSGEHILSGILCKRYDCSNIGFHMGKEFVTVDFSRLLTQEQIREAERLANEKVMEDVEIRAEYPDEATLAQTAYRSKKELEGPVRIVTVPGADCCACCGTHVKRTGEIGPIRVIGSEHYKSGVRLTVLIGEKALADYAQKSDSAAKLSALLSVRPDQTAAAVEKLMEERNALKLEYGALKLRMLEEKADAVPTGQKAYVLFEAGLSVTEARKLADRLQDKTGLTAIFCGDDETGYRYVILSKERDVTAFGKALNEALGGRGGGKAPMIQGSVAASRREIEAYLRRQGIDWT